MNTISLHPDPLEIRKAEHDIEPIFLKRWSPRAMNGDPVPDIQLLRLFEAARWAPSTYNEQEWRFLFAHRGTLHWQKFFDLLVEANQTWCAKAGVLACVLSCRVFEETEKLNPVHTFDAGAAFENLSLQGAAMGLVVHGMAGFDYEKARNVLNVPDDFKVEAMFAVGKPGDPEMLPEELREREEPSSRRPLNEIICEGPFSFPDASSE